MKADEGRTLTDAELEKLEEQIIEAYGDAAGEMQAIIDEYFEKFAALDEEYKALIGQTVNGEEWTEERYQQWRLAQLGRGERFNLMRDRLNERVTAANETAMAYINDATPGIYTLNRNYAAYEVGGTGDFTLLDEQTVRRLVAEQPDLMPYYPEEKAVRRGIDLEYGKKQITNSVTRGILTGRSSHEIAADLLTRVQDMSVTSAIRAARTAVTAAENGGRQASYEKAAAMGIEMEREWMATKDARTRPEHGAADGQRVAVDEPFIVGGQRLMTPGDTSRGASGWNIYNCRCCVRAVVKGHGRKRETYAEWLEKQKRLENSEGDDIISPQTNIYGFQTISGSYGIDDTIISNGKPTCNPRYRTDPAYSVNCQRCVQTFEFRRRGYDVVAKQMPKVNNTIVWGSECFTDQAGNPVQYTFYKTAAQVKKEIANAPDGARYGIYICWKGRGAGAHVFAAEKENGVVRYLDPQMGITDASSYFANGQAGKFGFFRMDDKQLTTDTQIVFATMESV